MRKLTPLLLLLAWFALAPQPATASVPPCDPEVPPENGVAATADDECTWEEEPECMWCEWSRIRCEDAVEWVLETDGRVREAIRAANFHCNSAFYSCTGCMWAGILCDNDDIVQRADWELYLIWRAIMRLRGGVPW